MRTDCPFTDTYRRFVSVFTDYVPAESSYCRRLIRAGNLKSTRLKIRVLCEMLHTALQAGVRPDRADVNTLSINRLRQAPPVEHATSAWVRLLQAAAIVTDGFRTRARTQFDYEGVWTVEAIRTVGALTVAIVGDMSLTNQYTTIRLTLDGSDFHAEITAKRHGLVCLACSQLLEDHTLARMLDTWAESLEDRKCQRK